MGVSWCAYAGLHGIPIWYSLVGLNIWRARMSQGDWEGHGVRAHRDFSIISRHRDLPEFAVDFQASCHDEGRVRWHLCFPNGEWDFGPPITLLVNYDATNSPRNSFNTMSHQSGITGGEELQVRRCWEWDQPWPGCRSPRPSSQCSPHPPPMTRVEGVVRYLLRPRLTSLSVLSPPPHSRRFSERRQATRKLA